MDYEYLTEEEKRQLKRNKRHVFSHAGRPGSLCGIPDRDGIIYDTGKKMNCKKCKKIKLNERWKRA